MADVRSMLRAERAARSSSGKTAISTTDRKRKAEELLEASYANKKAKEAAQAQSPSNGIDDAPNGPLDEDGWDSSHEAKFDTSSHKVIDTNNKEEQEEEDVDDFIKEMEQEFPNDEKAAVSRFGLSNGTISGRAMTSDELTTPAESQNVPATTMTAAEREAEVQEDKNEAERELKDELEQVKKMEDRFTKLKQRREQAKESNTQQSAELPNSSPTSGIQNGVYEDQDTDNDEEVDGWDSWGV